MTELYEICVGEIGIDPHYFMYEATMHEMELAIKGFRKRQINDWKRTRFLAYIIANKFNKKHISLDKILKLDEDKPKPISKPMTQDEIERLRAKANKYIEDTYGKDSNS